MTNQSTIDTLKQMRFSAMAKELESQLSDPDTYSSLGFEERIALLVDAEWNRRQANKLANASVMPDFQRQMLVWKRSNTIRTVSWTRRS